jgi:hypothetical protein
VHFRDGGPRGDRFSRRLKSRGAVVGMFRYLRDVPSRSLAAARIEELPARPFRGRRDHESPWQFDWIGAGLWLAPFDRCCALSRGLDQWWHDPPRRGRHLSPTLLVRRKLPVPNALNNYGLTSRRTIFKTQKTNNSSPLTKRWQRYSVMTASEPSAWPNFFHLTSQDKLSLYSPDL